MPNLLAIAQQAIDQCRGDHLVASFFSSTEHSPWLDRPWYCIAIGKAAGAMAAGALAVNGTHLVAGLVIAKQDSHRWVTDARLQTLFSAHPIPDETSFMAGQALVDFVAELPAQARVLFLLSGGASSLVEVLPSRDAWSDWQSKTQAWLASGWDIQRINAQRQQLSLIKGGRLLDHFPVDATILQLVIADVPVGAVEIVGSGLLTKQPQDARVNSSCLADNANLLAEIQRLLPQAHCVDAYVTAEVSVLAQQIAMKAHENRVYLWGGEPVVVLPADVGNGGRMQHLALLVAWLLRDCPFRWSFLALGSDGSDGSTHDAGACVNQDSIRQAQALGWDVQHVLATFTASELLADIDALIYTGDTGTNVNDVMILSCGGV